MNSLIKIIKKMGKITFSFRMVYASKYTVLKTMRNSIVNQPSPHSPPHSRGKCIENFDTRFIVINYEWDNLKYLVGFGWNFLLVKLLRQLSLISSLNTRSFYLWEIFIWIMSVNFRECLWKVEAEWKGCWFHLNEMGPLLIVCVLLFLCVLCWKRFPYSESYWGFMVFGCDFIRVVLYRFWWKAFGICS